MYAVLVSVAAFEFVEASLHRRNGKRGRCRLGFHDGQNSRSVRVLKISRQREGVDDRHARRFVSREVVEVRLRDATSDFRCEVVRQPMTDELIDGVAGIAAKWVCWIEMFLPVSKETCAARGRIERRRA